MIITNRFAVSFLLWLENDLFLTVHVSTASGTPDSVYHLITRKGQDLACQKLTDPVDPFGSEKVPHHTATRLKDFPPNLQDLLIFSSTATPDIGLVSRSKEPLSDDGVANVFTTTELLDDSKRATLPMGTGENMMESPSPVGTALDLSAKEPVYKPIPSDEMEKSPGPIPGYWVLNDEGVLSAWWIIYTESIRGGTTYPGMAALESNAVPSAPAPAPAAQPAQATQPSPFGAPSGPSFGTPSALGGPSAFGSASALGAKSSPWGSQATGGAAFGSSSFGSGPASTTPKFGEPSAFGGPSSFGQSSTLGQKGSPWGSGATGAAASKPAFGQSGFAAAATGSSGAFGSTSSGTNPSGGFASFANKGGFASLGSENNTSNSIFASKPSVDESMETEASTSFPAPTSKPATAANPFASTTPFKLTSSFQPDPNAKDSNVSPVDSKDSHSLFGSGFASALGGGTGSTKTTGFGSFGTQSTTPTTTPAPSRFLSQAPTTTQPGGIFGLPAKSSGDLFKKSPFGSTEVKTEAETPKPFKDSPNVPLPPESTSKASYPIGESSSSSAYSAADSPDTRKTPSDAPLPSDENLPPPPESPVDDAPLPPDPTTNKKVYDVKFPALPGADKPKPTPVDDAPLPPDPTTNKAIYATKFPPLPGADKPAEKSSSLFGGPKSSTYGSIFGGQNPEQKSASLFGAQKPEQRSTSLFSSQAAPTRGSIFDVGQKDIPKPVTGFKFPTDLPSVTDSDDEEEDGEEVDDEDEDDEGSDGAEDESEGSGVDVAKDLSPPSAAKDKTTPSITPGSSFGLGGSFSTISKPEPERRSLFGELGRSVPAFPQPNPLSPRSPSPVRNPMPSRVAGDHSRSFTAPGMASQILGATRRPQSRGGPITGKEAHVEDPRIEQQRRARAKKEAEETQLLVDEEDEIRQKLLNAPVEPTLQLDEFIAHAGPLPLADDNIPAQVEAVYRDINSMIDTLGLNARALTNFIHGHAVAFRHEHRDQDDLSNPDDWTIGELEDLRFIISEDLANELAHARVVDVEAKIAECQELLRELTRDRNKRNDLQKIVDARLDPDQALANRSLPLSAEQAARQNDLRRDFARFTKLLTEAEESLTMLRAKIASASAASGKPGSAPTIEAVMRTITKMTSMVEKRSGDIDVLENQMRRLRFSSPALDASTRSREGTPTPKKLGSSMVFSPERSLRESSFGLGSTTPQRSSIMVRGGHGKSTSFGSSSIGNGMFAVPSPLRRKMTGFVEEEKREIKERRDRRKLILGKLRNSVEKKGPSVWAMDSVE